jgi:hypothetical protein
MKNKTICLVLLAAFFFGKATAQSDTTNLGQAAVNQPGDVYIDYGSNKLDTPALGIGLNLATMSMGHQQAFGGGLSFKLNYRTNRAFGLSLDFLQGKTHEDYGYIVGEPQLSHWNLNAFYDYAFLTTPRFQAAFRMNAGVSGFSLQDNSIKESYSWYDEYGNEYEGERAVTVKKNLFLRIAPSINLNYKLSRNIAVEAQAGYDFYIGNANFGTTSQFNNYMIGTGIIFSINP